MNRWVDVGIHVGVIIVVALVVRFIAHRAIKRAVTAASLRRIHKMAEATGHELGRAVVNGDEKKVKRNARAAAVFAASGVSPEKRAEGRADTLSRGLCLLVDWAVAIVALLMVMSEVGVSLTPLLTSAGLGGLIIGLGAQSLIKDLLAGMFLVVEGQFGVGDTIDAGAVHGVVQEIGTRVTRLQSPDGEIWYVRNGEISTLGNRSQGWVTSTVDITVPVGRDPQQVITTLHEVVKELDADPEWHKHLLRQPVVVGLTAFDTVKMVFTIKVSCPQQSPVEHEIRARALMALASS